MASHAKAAHAFARQLFALSVVDGAVSAERVSGVLEYVERHKTPNPVMVLKAYQRMIAAELAKGVALVEHAGSVNDSLLAAVASSMTKKYGRKVTATAQPNPALLAGVRVRVGDDVYESSIAGQLAALSISV
ncbi:MAG TPA: F0F1 ATP synthase subunit delta [Opitutaceae bacterium]|jgi:F-type H+-transporting ATPase subunit delta|nr:F0F1 ATP synthase subunit delta [Opitutaceae bacterium]